MMKKTIVIISVLAVLMLVSTATTVSAIRPVEKMTSILKKINMKLLGDDYDRVRADIEYTLKKPSNDLYNRLCGTDSQEEIEQNDTEEPPEKLSEYSFMLELRSLIFILKCRYYDVFHIETIRI